LQHLAVENANDRFVLTIERMKMRRIVIAKIHVNQDARKLANPRHSIPLTYYFGEISEPLATKESCPTSRFHNRG